MTPRLTRAKRKRPTTRQTHLPLTSHLPLPSHLPPPNHLPSLTPATRSLPPATRSRAALGLTAAAALGRFQLQVCADCGAVQYPPRETCHRCLSERLPWTDQTGSGELIAETTVHLSQDSFFRERAPWRIGMVRLDVGPTLIAHLPAVGEAAPARVRVAAKLDKSGQGVLVAFPIDEVITMADDRQLRELTCDPKGRKVLVTDGQTAVGQALVRQILAAGAKQVWVGHGKSWKKSPGCVELASLPRVAMQPVDLTDSKSVKRLAGDIADQVDILINNAEVHPPLGMATRGGLATRDIAARGGIAARNGVDQAQAEMDINYLGLLRLAQEMGPAMASRGADSPSGPLAWVNLLSIYALSNFPAQGTFSAAKAAALSLSQCLRAEMRPSGVRVVNVFPGPIDDEWSQALPPPKLTPQALAKAVVGALKDGVEDVYPGDVAQEWLLKWRENPKILERELSA
jgi:NAD(P)-dependent dehydrogenase (short-subunit alcohol dehydrogenase family)/uncharacterized OB-fold protein